MQPFDPELSSKRAGSFLSSLFDLSFTSFITLKIIRVLYIAGMLLGALVALALIVSAFNVNSGVGVLALFVSPIVFLLMLVWTRVGLELIAIIFRIEQNTAVISQAQLNEIHPTSRTQ